MPFEDRTFDVVAPEAVIADYYRGSSHGAPPYTLIVRSGHPFEGNRSAEKEQRLACDGRPLYSSACSEAHSSTSSMRVRETTVNPIFSR